MTLPQSEIYLAFHTCRLASLCCTISSKFEMSNSTLIDMTFTVVLHSDDYPFNEMIQQLAQCHELALFKHFTLNLLGGRTLVFYWRETDASGEKNRWWWDVERPMLRLFVFVPPWDLGWIGALVCFYDCVWKPGHIWRPLWCLDTKG